MSRDDKFFENSLNEMQGSFSNMMPSKTKMFALGAGAVLINAALFVGAIGVIAYAVKWVIATQ